MTALNFYPVTAGPAGAFAANTLARLVITRDAITNAFVGYVNGVQQITFVDSGSLAVFSNNIAHFLRDDSPGQGEVAGGLLSTIAIYEGALTAQEVAALGGAGTPIIPIPVPTPALLPGLIGLGLGVLKKRKTETS
jgi:hypothetical protein